MENYFEDINNKKVIVGGKEYTFTNRIGESKELTENINKLFKKTFWITFESFGGEHEPHALLDGDKVVASVSVNQIPFVYRGKKYFFIQLGGVMTDEEYRNKGLGRYLLEEIKKRWEPHCDLIFLFANNDVTEYYPRFGFNAGIEYVYTAAVKNIEKGNIVKLDMGKPENVKLVYEHYQNPNIYSALKMTDNKAVFGFYYEGEMADNIWYDKDTDLIYCLEKQDELIKIYDILGKSSLTLEEVTKRAAGVYGNISKAEYSFTPLDTDGMDCKIRNVDDSHFFILGKMADIFSNDKLMIPEVTHS